MARPGETVPWSHSGLNEKEGVKLVSVTKDDTVVKVVCGQCGQPMEYGLNGLEGRRIPCPGCCQEVRLPRFREMGNALRNRWAKKMSQLDLKRMRGEGWKFVSVLGCNNPGEDCAAVLALKGKAIPINEFPGLPLPGCDVRPCKCCVVVCQEDGSI